MIYSLLSFLVRLLSYIPFRVLYIISNCLFYVVYYVIRYRRAIVRKNIVESFPDKSKREIELLEKNFYRFFTDNILESSICHACHVDLAFGVGGDNKANSSSWILEDWKR